MATPRLPARRFTTAGASKDEVAELQLAFEHSDLGVQEAMLEHFRSLSAAGLREYLANWRDLQNATSTPPGPGISPAKPKKVSHPPEAPEAEIAVLQDSDLPGLMGDDEDTAEPDED